MFDFSSLQTAALAWAAVHGLRVVLIAVLAFVADRIAHSVITRIIRRVVRQGNGSKAAEKKREDTLITVATSSIDIVVLTVALLMILSEFGVAIGPLLAAAGIAGLAFGFGGQYLIRDLISGLFILLENQYRVGDVVCFDKTCGTVETLSLRMTTLRDLDGTVHHVPHGQVTTVSNLSKKFARVNLDIGIGYASNLEKVIEVVNETGATLAEEPEWKDKIISAPHFARVNDFADSAIIIKILGDTAPLAQWDVAGEFRKRLKIAFDANGIELPFPQRVVRQIKD